MNLTKLALSPFRFTFGVLLLTTVSLTTNASAATVSFLVDPVTIDGNMDGFITDNEFQPIGSDGTIFNFLPTDNLTGSDRFLLSEATGLQYGGGGASTLSFDFSVNQDVDLESYTIADAMFIFGNPDFNLNDGATILSANNTSLGSGLTHDFVGGPIRLDAGTTYTFDVQTTGAAIQSFQSSWTYTATSVPEPSSMALLALGGCVVVFRRRRA